MRKGTALIYTILVVSFISIISVVIARLSIIEVRMAGAISDSLVAYYTAEAGLEGGLLMWRYDKDKEVKSDFSQNPLEIDLGGEKKYQLRIWYKDEKAEKEIKKDEIWELETDGLSSVNIDCKFKNIVNPLPSDPRPYFGLEVTEIKKSGSTNSSSETKFYDQANFSNFNGKEYRGNMDIPLSSVKRLIIKPWIREASGTASIVMTPLAGKIDSGTHTIESTGIYKNVKRKLVAKIDRSSGTILGVYDFLIYGGQEIKQ